MNIEDILHHASKRHRKRTDLFKEKSAAYTGDNTDKFGNIKDIASILHYTPQQAIIGLMMKHIVAIKDVCMSGNIPSEQWVDEYIGDIHNYLDLLECLWIEERNNDR